MDRKIRAISITLALSLLSTLVPKIFPQTEAEVLAIKCGKIIRVGQPPIENGIIIINKGRIVSVGISEEIPKEAKTLDASEWLLFPGFINAGTDMGIAEDRDSQETFSPLSPHLGVLDALDPGSKYIALARKSGTTAALIAPLGGGLLPGQSALVNLAGESREKMVIRNPVAMHVQLGESAKATPEKNPQAPATRMGAVASLRQILLDAQHYYNNQGQGSEPDIKLSSLIPVVQGHLPVIMQVNRASDILAAIRLAEEFKLRIILSQAVEASTLIDMISASRIPVILAPVEAWFQKTETEKADPGLARILASRKIPFAFQTGGVRNGIDLLRQAREAIQNGLSYEAALKALTLDAARILGVADRLGSIEPGKIANLVAFDRDPLRDNGRPRLVIINGRCVEKL
ncbi:MAG: amidohydrolase family protein [Candidatus Aminicenantes bacterium]|nr:amidohydrolase family protein [Candidatus Aminicenantes bacterium]